MTDSLDLLALVTCHTLYFLFRVGRVLCFCQTVAAASLLQPSQAFGGKPLDHDGTPYPEVTGLICRVPQRGCSRAPQASRLTHLCRFTVRMPCYQRLGDFLVSVASADPLPPRGLCPISSQVQRETDLPISHPTTLDCHFQSTARLAYCVPPSLQQGSTGILTCCPSATPFGLVLGSDQPWEDEPGPGNLGFSVSRILICFIATHACMVTCMQSTSVHTSASTHIQRSSTTQLTLNPRLRFKTQSRSSSAQNHSISELLRTLQMVAASKPTS
eukprot:TRINITY_DN332_c0_g1_i2.p1 TRINITY_DN332_c0_g1~~TRINITY_DN332_c0_g1_i2.p1  ORF type:complete len:272 (+),score=-65.00 TRINITY_DN332_c0_g1_i2:227-1042(+)